MTRKFMAMVSAAALAATAFAPIADAHDWRGYHGDYGRHGYYRYGHGNAAAAGAVGLIFGLALGAALSQPRTDRCYDSCGRGDYYGPPPGEYGRPPPRAYDDPGSAYEQDYGPAPYKSQCTRQERQWDRYANRYVSVDVPC
jgi:hypothetical protein